MKKCIRKCPRRKVLRHFFKTGHPSLLRSKFSFLQFILNSSPYLSSNVKKYFWKIMKDMLLIQKVSNKPKIPKCQIFEKSSKSWPFIPTFVFLRFLPTLKAETFRWGWLLRSCCCCWPLLALHKLFGRMAEDNFERGFCNEWWWWWWLWLLPEKGRHVVL